MLHGHERIEINPDVMFGKPVVKGTRLTVELISSELRAGMTFEQIIEGHPRLTRDDILAAQAYAESGNYLGPLPSAHAKRGPRRG